MTHSAEPDAKVLFRVPASDEDDHADVETLWAFSLGEDLYKIDNLPFFAYGVSWNDTVYAPYDHEEGRATFQRAVSKSGNRTVRIIFETPVGPENDSQKVLDELVALGCTYEGANKLLIAVNVPRGIELSDVAEILIGSDVDWEYADPAYEELFPDED